jgi:hypothetical protein
MARPCGSMMGTGAPVGLDKGAFIGDQFCENGKAAMGGLLVHNDREPAQPTDFAS